MKRNGCWALVGLLLLAIAAAGPGPAHGQQGGKTAGSPGTNEVISDQQTQPWARTYGGSAKDRARSIQQTADGGYVVAGKTASFGAGLDDFWVLKLDAGGGIQWQRTYGGPGDDEGYSIHQTSDGGYVVAGATNSFGAGDFDVWVLKLDAGGAIQWQKAYGGPASDEARSIQQTADGGYIVAGFTQSFGTSSADFWVLKLDAGGGIQWQRTYGSDADADDERARPVQQTADGGYIVAGATSSFGAGGKDVWVLKLDAGGAIQWQKAYGGPGDDRARAMRQTSDGGYILTGRTRSFGAGDWDVWVLKLDGSGNVQWQKTYGGPSVDRVRGIEQTSDGGYVMSGVTFSFGAGGGDAWIVKLDAGGAVQWQRTYGGPSLEWARAVQQTSDGGYIATAWVSFGAGREDFWVLKLDANGEIPGCSLMGTSSATVTDTAATITTSGGTPTTSNGGSFTTAAIVTSTSVIPRQTCPVADADIQGSVAVGGAPVVGAEVTIRNQITGAKGGTSTDATGSYQFDPVDPGRYKIIIKPLVVSTKTTVSGSLQVKGAPSAGTKVILKNTATRAKTRLSTGPDGRFSFTGVVAGTYRLTLRGIKVP